MGAVNRNAVDGGIGKAAAGGYFEPAPGAIAAAESAAARQRPAILRGDLLQVRANRADVGGGGQCVKTAADEVVGAITKTMQKSGGRKLHRSIDRKNGDGFAGAIQQ